MNAFRVHHRLRALLAAFPPLSTDMYLPAIPALMQDWETSAATINLTLVGFFVSFSLALLVYGPLSDRFGRRPMLLAGISLYVLASLACAQATSASSLIMFSYFVNGALSMAFISLDWPDRILTLGAMAVVTSALVLGLLPRLRARGEPEGF